MTIILGKNSSLKKRMLNGLDGVIITQIFIQLNALPPLFSYILQHIDYYTITQSFIPNFYNNLTHYCIKFYKIYTHKQIQIHNLLFTKNFISNEIYKQTPPKFYHLKYPP